MPANPTTQQMGEKHEEHLAKVFGGKMTRSSGNKWFDQGDGRNDHDDPYAFCWDGKSAAATTKSISVTRDMIAKISEEAQGEHPAIGLRFYGNANLDQVDTDWAAMPTDVLENLLGDARAWAKVVASLGGLTRENIAEYMEQWGKTREDNHVLADGARRMTEAHEADLARLVGLRDELSRAHDALMAAGERLSAQNLELEALRAQAQGPVPPLGSVPRLPWAIVRLLPRPSGFPLPEDAATVVQYDTAGLMTTGRARDVRVERTMANRPKVFVDDVQVRDADVYTADGTLLARVCRDDPAIEVG